MTTLYGKSPEVWDALEGKGFPSIAALSKVFNSPKEMDAALGYAGAASKWGSGSNLPGAHSEVVAKLWLEANRPAQAKSDDCSTFMVVCRPAIGPKAVKILTMMGCEVVEI